MSRTPAVTFRRLALALALGAALPLTVGAAVPATAASHAAAADPAGPKLAYTRVRLPNGLTVLVHEDHKAPVPATSRPARPASRTCSNT
jgi:hypothetical protein